jgi:hypothetical protein
MTIQNLFNKVCSWRRRIAIDENEFNEIIYSDLWVGSDVSCARQVGPGLNMRKYIDTEPPGEYNRKIVKYYMLPTDIQEGDIIKFEGSELEKVEDVRDAAGRGHHLEILARAIEEVGEEDLRVG